jgi:type VI secretion system protein ImpA
MELQSLLASRDDEAPSGENLEYDPDFITLELAAQPGEERQAGDEILPAEDPDWGDVREKALAVLERSHDLRAAAYLAEAALHLDGLTAFAEVTAYVRGLMEQHWDTAHPQLDAEDDNDPTARINALQNLAGTARALRRTPLSESRGFGRATLRDLMSASGQAVAEGAMDSDQIAASFQDTDPEVLSARLEATTAAARSATSSIRCTMPLGTGPWSRARLWCRGLQPRKRIEPPPSRIESRCWNPRRPS